jgi:hypothetical protein
MARQDKPINNTDCGDKVYNKDEDFGKFDDILASKMITKFNCENKNEGLEKIDHELCNKINLYEDVDELVDTVFSCITAACIEHSRYQEEQSI